MVSELTGYIQYHSERESAYRAKLEEIKKHGSRRQFMPCLEKMEYHRQCKNWLCDLQAYQDKYR